MYTIFDCPSFSVFLFFAGSFSPGKKSERSILEAVQQPLYWITGMINAPSYFLCVLCVNLAAKFSCLVFVVLFEGLCQNGSV